MEKKQVQPRNRKRYNWKALKLEFMEGPWETIAQFRRDKGFPSHRKSTYFTKKTYGWAEDKRKLIATVAEESAKDIVENKRYKAKKIRIRQANLAREMQKKGREALKKLDPKTAEEARKLIQTGLQEEREALGLSREGGAKSLTQVNVGFPKTRFDKIIDAKDFEGILDFLATVKRERVRRIGTVSSAES